jgi:hypothetical protein
MYASRVKLFKPSCNEKCQCSHAYVGSNQHTWFMLNPIHCPSYCNCCPSHSTLERSFLERHLRRHQLKSFGLHARRWCKNMKLCLRTHTINRSCITALTAVCRRALTICVRLIVQERVSRSAVHVVSSMAQFSAEAQYWHRLLRLLVLFDSVDFRSNAQVHSANLACTQQWPQQFSAGDVGWASFRGCSFDVCGHRLSAKTAGSPGSHATRQKGSICLNL